MMNYRSGYRVAAEFLAWPDRVARLKHLLWRQSQPYVVRNVEADVASATARRARYLDNSDGNRRLAVGYVLSTDKGKIREIVQS